jgi:hypothetical protein
VEGGDRNFMAAYIEQVKDFVEAVGEENIVILVAEGS